MNNKTHKIKSNILPMLVTLGTLADAVPLEWRWMLLVTSGTRDDEQFVSGSWVRLTLTHKVKVKTLFVSDNPPQKRLTSDFWLHWIWGCLGPKVWILSNPALIRTLDPKVWAPLLVETKQTLPRAVGNKSIEMYKCKFKYLYLYSILSSLAGKYWFFNTVRTTRPTGMYFLIHH